MSFTRSVEFLGRSIIVKYTFHALHGTLLWISPLDRAPGHFGQGIILVVFDGHNAYITLKKLHRCSLYTCLCCVNFLASFLEKH